MTNPFAIETPQWQLTLHLPPGAVDYFTDSLAEDACAVSCFEEGEDSGIWQLEVLYSEKPEQEAMRARLTHLANACRIPVPDFIFSAMDPDRWEADVAAQFPPLRIGRFYVYGTHVETAPPLNTIPLCVNAGLAFGTGEHETTRGCLLALQWLQKRKHIPHGLDMGCGSGILAMALARQARVPVVAVDIDPKAVAVTRANLRLNHLHRQVTAHTANGFANPRLWNRAPFPLIFANILLRPLVRMAPDLSRALAPGGVLIASGILQRQETALLSALRMQGLFLRTRFRCGQWSTLVLIKKRRHA